MPRFRALTAPREGAAITKKDGRWVVPDEPIVPFMPGDGCGPDIWRAAVRVFDAAVAHAYGGARRIVWFEVPAGEKARELTGEWLPSDTLEAIKAYRVGIKGPLTTAVGGSVRSLTATLRQALDLYACIRPIRYIPGAPSPVRAPERIDVVIFREHTEDVFAGIEWERGSAQAERLIAFLSTQLGKRVRADSAVGVRPMSSTGSKRLVRLAIRYALDHGRRSVTLVHQGDVLRQTDGAFRDWGYEVAREEFPGQIVPEGQDNPDARPVIRDRAADTAVREMLTRVADYDVVAATNQSGHSLSSVCAAQVGGLGLVPGATVGDEVAVFEATHGPVRAHAGEDVVNPSSVILSGALLFRHLGWPEAAASIEAPLERTIQQKLVTVDLEAEMEGATRLTTSRYADAIIANMERKGE